MIATNPAAQPRSWQFWGRALLDLGLAGLVTAIAVILNLEVAATRGLPPEPLPVVVAAIYGAALLARRTWPLGVLGVMLGAGVVYSALLGFPVFMLGPAVLAAVYTVGSLLGRDRSLPALLLVELVMVGLIVTGSSFPGWSSVLLFALLIAAAWFLGDLARRWRTAAEQHEARAYELSVAREELARHAVSEERLRIARELHDVVAHSMTVVALQAGSGRMAGEKDPAAAQAALETIEQASREALADMRRLVGVLRQGEESGTEPTPGLSDLDRLVEEVGRAGIEVELTRSGSLEVSAGLGLAVYRIAQEALTNVVRHSGAHRARLRLDSTGDWLTLEVSNGPGASSPAPVEGGGHGIAGMRERASLYGGSLTAGPGRDGGFVLTARFPAASGLP